MKKISLFAVLLSFYGLSALAGDFRFIDGQFNIEELTEVKVGQSDPDKLGHPISLSLKGKYFTFKPDTSPLFDVKLVSYDETKTLRIRKFRLLLRGQSEGKRVPVGAMGHLLLPEAEFSTELEFAVYAWAQGREKDITILEIGIGDKLKTITATYDLKKEEWDVDTERPEQKETIRIW